MAVLVGTRTLGSIPGPQEISEIDEIGKRPTPIPKLPGRIRTRTTRAGAIPCFGWRGARVKTVRFHDAGSTGARGLSICMTRQQGTRAHA